MWGTLDLLHAVEPVTSSVGHLPKSTMSTVSGQLGVFSSQGQAMPLLLWHIRDGGRWCVWVIPVRDFGTHADLLVTLGSCVLRGVQEEGKEGVAEGVEIL